MNHLIQSLGEKLDQTFHRLIQINYRVFRLTPPTPPPSVPLFVLNAAYDALGEDFNLAQRLQTAAENKSSEASTVQEEMVPHEDALSELRHKYASLRLDASYLAGLAAQLPSP